MGEFTDKAKGIANEVAGKAKEAIGKNTNDPGLAAEGAAQGTAGKGQQAIGTAKGVLGDKI
jgi:uncharacterized protein YjbJ (UPF0337 family)